METKREAPAYRLSEEARKAIVQHPERRLSRQQTATEPPTDCKGDESTPAVHSPAWP